MEIRRAATVADVCSVNVLYDSPATEAVAAEFLSAPGHHLFLAWDDDRAVGFVSGVELVHPDKGREMFLYELAVDEDSRRHGIGRALVERLAAQARDLGCYDMWVLTDDNNVAAVRTYNSSGGVNDPVTRMITWKF